MRTEVTEAYKATRAKLNQAKPSRINSNAGMHCISINCAICTTQYKREHLVSASEWAWLTWMGIKAALSSLSRYRLLLCNFYTNNLVFGSNIHSWLSIHMQSNAFFQQTNFIAQTTHISQTTAAHTNWENEMERDAVALKFVATNPLSVISKE